MIRTTIEKVFPGCSIRFNQLHFRSRNRSALFLGAYITMGCGSSTIAPTPANTKPKASPVKTPQSNNDDLQTLKPKSDKVKI